MHFVTSEPILHPETMQPILARGQYVSIENLNKLNYTIGVDSVKGYWCADFAAVEYWQKRIANTDTLNR